MIYTDMDVVNAKIAQLEQERYLIERGCPVDDVDFYHSKISGMVTDGKTFEKAAEEFINAGGIRAPKYTGPVFQVNTGAAFNGGDICTRAKDMNSLIRNCILR